MAIISKTKKSMFETDTIALLQITGKHILASGRVATVLTDEQFTVGDSVFIMSDGRGEWVIIGGIK